METFQERGRKKVTLSIIFILSGIMLDTSDIILNLNYDLWLTIANITRDLRVLGFSIIAYSLCRFDRLKLKAFLFMMCIWGCVVLVSNTIDIKTIYTIPVFYSVYLYWLYRVYFIDNNEVFKLSSGSIVPILAQESYNIFIPVSSFRGLLKALFVPLSNSYYETTILVHGKYMYYVSMGSFVKIQCMDNKIKNLLESGNAYIQKCKPTGKQMKRINKIIGKKSVTGFRDCRRLKI